MPMPKPKPTESKDDFIGRCMVNSVMLDEFEDSDQRYAVCNQQWGSMTSNIQTIKTLASFKRYEKWQNSDYLVLPAVLLTEGVHNDLYYPPEQLAKFPSAWDGSPVPIHHPEDNGIPVSCNSPKALPNSVGYVFNTIYSDGKLKAELWLNKKKLQEFDNNTLRDLEAGRPVEISTGLWSDETGAAGEWNGEAYQAAVSDIKPDHVALLPGAIGACSWRDGCGVPRLNQEKGGIMTKEREEFWKQFHELFHANKKNAVSHDEIRDQLRGLVPRSAKDYVFIVDVYDDYFIYELERFAVDEAPLDVKFYKQKYKKDGSGNVSLEGPAEEVTLKRDYVPVTNSEPTISEPTEPVDQDSDPQDDGQAVQNDPDGPKTNDCVDGSGDVKTTGTKKTVWKRLKDWFQANEVECEDQQRLMLALESLDSIENNQENNNDDGGGSMSKELVKTLIEDDRTHYSEDDREWLEGLEEDKLKKMSPKEVKANTQEPTAPVEPKADEPKPVNLSDLLASKEFAQAVGVTVKTLMEKEQKAELVAKAKKIKGLSLTDAELKGMPESALVKLVKANAAADFSGRGADSGGSVASDDDGVPEPPSVLSAKVEKEVEQ